MAEIRILDVGGTEAFGLVPPCADPGFDHRSCDYWEDEQRGSKAARASWLEPVAPPSPPRRPEWADNPFAPPAPSGPPLNLFLDLDEDDAAPDNPFVPRRTVERRLTTGVPRKLALLDRGRGVFGSYAKVLLRDGEPAVYGQFGPLSAYPRAQRLRDLYRQLPQSPLPAVITCIATTAAARGQGLARRLVLAVCDDLAGRGFSAVEAYPEAGARPAATSAATVDFWRTCGFDVAVPDARFPVLRREL